MMLGTVLNLSRAATAAARAAGTGLLSRSPSPLSTWSSRSFCGAKGLNATPVSLQMIDYALSHARSLKTDESYAQGLLVLEQCLSTHSNEADDATSQNSGAVVLLAMSTLLSERGSFDDAIDKLQMIQDLEQSHLGVRVASMEGLVGLNLQLERDDAALMLTDKCLQLLGNDTTETGDGVGSEALHVRAKTLKGLLELVHGNLESAESFFQASTDDKGCTGNAALSYGEILHSMGKFLLAKELYQKAMEEISAHKEFADPHTLGVCCMYGREVQLAATCALGQLEGQLGNFSEAEEILTRVLTKTEEHFATKAAFAESIGTKASFTDCVDTKADVVRRDLVALTRGAYAEVLCVQQNRKDEGEKMKSWAETAWRDCGLSLAEALEISGSSSKVPIIDARISRAL